MKINEVETLAGITKKNIRFYEAQGLLSPARNSENGYRDYGEEDVRILRRIKLFRKMGFPIEEIRQMFTGVHTVGDGMRRQLISLEREQRNLEQSMTLCRELQNKEIPVSSLDAESILDRMEKLESEGVSFQNRQEEDIRVLYIAPVVVTAGVVVLMVCLSAFLFWAYRTSPEASPPGWFLLLIVGLFAAVGFGAVLALLQRIGEIKKGEMNDAKNY